MPLPQLVDLFVLSTARSVGFLCKLLLVLLTLETYITWSSLSITSGYHRVGFAFIITLHELRDTVCGVQV